MSNKIEDTKTNKGATTNNTTKDETSGSSGSNSSSFWDRLINTLLPKGGGR